MLVSVLATLAIVPQAKPAQPAAQPKPELEIKTVKILPGIRPLAFARGPSDAPAQVAMTLENTSVIILNAANRITVRTMTGHPQPAYAIAWSPDGAWLATGDETARILLWDARTGQRLKEMRQHIRGIQHLSFNLGRTLLVSTGKDDAVKQWDPLTGKLLGTILGNGANLYSATFHPKLNQFAVGTLGVGSRLYDAKTSTAVSFFTAPNLEEINDVDFNPAGTLLATSGRRGTSRIWDLKTLKGLGNVGGHTDWAIHARFSPNGKYIATSSSDKTVRVYNAKTFKQVLMLEGQSTVGSPICWTTDGKWLLSVGELDSLQIHSVTPPQGPEVAKPQPKKKTTRRRRRR